ncbi:MAG TPA: NAD(P)-dependent oxidoreductase [Methanocella sp.]|jgi:phosphoglycerate dehydrogenase-like enzyme
MLIVATDSDYLPDACRQRLEKLGELRVCEGRPESFEDFMARVEGADIAIVTHYRLKSATFEDTTLKFIALDRTGYDDVDLDAATLHGVAVANAPGYANEAVAEHVFAMLLTFLRKIREADDAVRSGKFDCTGWEGRELAGKTLGVLGTGRIGMRVADIARSIGMDVVAFDARPSAEKAHQHMLKYVDLNHLYESSDFISIHLPLTSETTGLIDREAFARMKQSAVLVNTARGPVIDREALLCALENGLIAGACLDVFNEEPVPPDSPLLQLSNTILTPHIAYDTREAKDRRMAITIENIEAFVAGKPKNLLNPCALVLPAGSHDKS